jgi:hypothetical protein
MKGLGLGPRTYGSKVASISLGKRKQLQIQYGLATADLDIQAQLVFHNLLCFSMVYN